MHLDKAQPFGDVMGAYHGARFYQFGHYFDAAGAYLFSNPGLKPPAGATARVSLDADGSPVGDPEVLPEGAPRPTAPPAQAQKPPEVPADLSQEQKLAQLPAAQLIAMVKQAGGPPIEGAGSKKRAIEWLLANVQE